MLFVSESRHGAAPRQAPIQPANRHLRAGTARSVRVVPYRSFTKQRRGHATAAGALTTLPPPRTKTRTGTSTGTNVARASVGSTSVTAQTTSSLEHASDRVQPSKCHPRLGAARIETRVSYGNDAEQRLGH